LPVVTALVGIVLIVVTAGALLGWQRWGRTVVTRPIYRIAVENIRVTPPPAWIRGDVRAEVFRDGALNDLTIFDKDVTIRVYQAFELHPWVAKVKRVSKQPPARLEVDLEYRRPVAWVEVPRGVLPGSEGGVIPVDRDAVVLPSRDFSPDDVAEYLRLSIAGISPCGLAGDPWGDPRVAGAARIAELLGDSWRQWNLFRIRLDGDTDSARHSRPPVYEIETLSQRRIIWGHAPQVDAPHEPGAAIKLSRLAKLAGSSGGFSSTSESKWDLRTP
jgi:hypothetical protein